MDFLTPYVNVARHHSDGSATLTISTEQGSHFAKYVAIQQLSCALVQGS